MEVSYLRNWVGVCAGITVRADCANKRRIYKLVWEVCERIGCCDGILQDAPVAQIRGGFINWDGRFAKVDVWVGRKLWRVSVYF